MTFKRIVSLLEIAFIITVIFIISIVVFYMIRSNNYEKNFNDLKLGTHIVSIKENWGEPDNNFIHQDTLIILTYNDGIMTDYVFKFNRRNKKLVEKWEGD